MLYVCKKFPVLFQTSSMAPLKRILYYQDLFFDRHTEIRINDPLVNRIRGSGWFRDWSDMVLFKFSIAQRVFAFQKRTVVMSELFFDDSPNICRFRACVLWKGLYDEKRNLLDVNVHFRRDMEYGIKARLFEVDQVVDIEEHLLKFQI